MAFGDSDDYLNNFYTTYYRPERVLVLEEDGEVRSMTTWFDTALRLPNGAAYRAAYLYAVATHPDCRGRGLAAKLLAGADDYFRGQNIPLVTTVPAEPSLHRFFGANGFREGFVTARRTLKPTELPPSDGRTVWTPATPAEYGAIREALLGELPHIFYPEDALVYQEGCCRLSGGGLFRGETAEGAICLCAEYAGHGVAVLKELLGSPAALRLAIPDLPRILPAEQWEARGPASKIPDSAEGWKFGMWKLLNDGKFASFDGGKSAYLGLAFD
jgi:GNAT superfamily N-acetyltransferase